MYTYMCVYIYIYIYIYICVYIYIHIQLIRKPDSPTPLCHITSSESIMYAVFND